MYFNHMYTTPSAVCLCNDIGLVSLILCVLYHCTMCTGHPDLVSFAFYAIPIFQIIIFYLLVCICHVFFCHFWGEPERAPPSALTGYRIFLNVSTRFFFTVTSRNISRDTLCMLCARCIHTAKFSRLVLDM